MSASISPTAILDSLAGWGERPAIVHVSDDRIERFSFAFLAESVRNVAYRLIRDGVGPGTAVGLFAPNSVDWVIARLAIWAAGGVAVAIDDVTDVAEVQAIIRDAALQHCYTSAAHVEAVLAACGDDAAVIEVFDAVPPSVVMDRRIRPWRRSRRETPCALPTITEDMPAMIVYTSGTTGQPKSFALTYANLFANIRALIAEGLAGPDDRVVLPLPLHHVFPLVIGTLVPLFVGASVILPHAATGPAVIRALKSTEATILIGVPRLYEALLSGVEGQIAARGRLPLAFFRVTLALSAWCRRAFGIRLGRKLFAALHRRIGPKLRVLGCGGARLAPEAINKLQGLGWELMNGYGLAETASVFTANLPGRQRQGTEGRPLAPDLDIRIADPDGDGIGEIELRGASVFAGYRNDPEANAAAFTDDGWFRTGDLGSLDADGYVTVTGRIKELIVLGGGKNVFPDVLERAYGAAPVIAEIAILERDGALVALVVPDREHLSGEGAGSIEDIIRVHLASVARTLPSFERLSGFALWGEPLPKTRLGKFQRFRLRELYDRAARGEAAVRPAVLSDDDKAFLAAPSIGKVWRLLEQRYAGKPLSLDANPQLDLGIDSLEWVTLGLEIEAAVGARLTEHDVEAIATVRDLLSIVHDRVAAGETDAGRADAAAEAGRMAADWLGPRAPWERALFAGVHGINRACVRLLFRLRVEGGGHLPQGGPFILVANHASDLDIAVLSAALPSEVLKRLYWSGDRDRLFGGPLRRRLLHAMRVFPVGERDAGGAIATAAAVLERGEELIWFPESWRTPDGHLQRFRPGIGHVLSIRPVPVVPAYLAGTFDALPRDRRLPRLTPVKVIFGEPVPESAWLDAAGHPASPKEIAEILRNHVARLAKMA